MKVICAVLGQSNEQGANVIGQVNRTAGFGAPALDIIAPQGGYGSPWPSAAQKAGELGHWVTFRNHARGATGLCDTWVGIAKNYVFAMTVAHGSYIISGGNLYKAVGAIGTVYTLNVAPSSGVGTSGLASWTNLGTVTAEDTDGKVYAVGSSRFDPNGLLAAIVSDLSLQTGYDRKAVLVAIGQGDKTLGSTQEQYKQAMVNVANYFSSLDIYTYLGMTNYGATAGLDAYLTVTLQPARLQALTELAGNQFVKVGYDARAGLGVLPTNPTDSRPGLLADNIHMNLAAATACGVGWGKAIVQQQSKTT